MGAGGAAGVACGAQERGGGGGQLRLRVFAQGPPRRAVPGHGQGGKAQEGGEGDCGDAAAAGALWRCWGHRQRMEHLRGSRAGSGGPGEGHEHGPAWEPQAWGGGEGTSQRQRAQRRCKIQGTWGGGGLWQASPVGLSPLSLAHSLKRLPP